MKQYLFLSLVGAAAIGHGYAQGLYYTGSEVQQSLPLRWTVGLDAVWDDNVNPTAVGVGHNDSAFSLNPYVGASFVRITPQTTWDVFTRLGLVYYIDKPAALGSKDIYAQDRLEVNYTHRFSERLRFSSRNFVSYELEPNYAYGFATNRQAGNYLYWQTDNSVGYRWTERLATYTGFSLTGLNYDDNKVANSDRFTWLAYNQFRYQITPQSVLTGEYRYGQTTGNGVSNDSTDQYILAGIEHRFSPTTILIARVGAQHQDQNSRSSSSPYAELAMSSQLNDQFTIHSFLRYGIENYDNIRVIGAGVYEYTDRKTLRVGVNGEYALNPMFSIFGGVDYIPSSFGTGMRVAGVGPLRNSGLSEDLINTYLGLSVKFNQHLFGTLSYNYTNSTSDFSNYSYDRNRVSVGVRGEF